jgi:DNA-binding CsgD family transcriptional regulator
MTGSTFVDGITIAERRTLEALCERGETNGELAARLHLTEQTIKFHLTNVMRKSETTNRTALVLWWIRVGRYANTPEEGQA